ncbi:MAG: ABC transporter permease [Actinomycetota bacterium]
MNTLMTVSAAAVAAGAALLFTTVGEIITERAGVLNIGLEGMMAVGAVTGFLVMDQTGSAYAGVLGALASGAVVALVHAVFVVTLRVDQVVSGLGIAIGASGLATVIGRDLVGVPPRATVGTSEIPLLSDLPVVGDILFSQGVLTYAAIIVALAAAAFLSVTRTGLHLQAVGENPLAADGTGIKVELYRYSATVFGGALAGIGGATLSLQESPGWSQRLVGGRGWICVALVIFAFWSPSRAIGGAFLFGFLQILALEAQILDLTIPTPILAMLPFIGTLVVLILISFTGVKSRLGAPAALGRPYARGA